MVGSGFYLSFLPDAVGWLLFAIALGMVGDLHPGVRALRRLAVVGLIVCLPRLLRFHEREVPWEHVYRFLQAGAAAVAVIFAWRLCRLVADMGMRADRPSLKANAELRFPLYVAGVLMLFVGKFPAELSRELFGDVGGWLALAAMFVYIAITISLMMGLMASVARMCVRLEREHQGAAEGGTEQGQGPPPP